MTVDQPYPPGKGTGSTYSNYLSLFWIITRALNSFKVGITTGTCDFPVKQDNESKLFCLLKEIIYTSKKI